MTWFRSLHLASFRTYYQIIPRIIIYLIFLFEIMELRLLLQQWPNRGFHPFHRCLRRRLCVPSDGTSCWSQITWRSAEINMINLSGWTQPKGPNALWIHERSWRDQKGRLQYLWEWGFVQWEWDDFLVIDSYRSFPPFPAFSTSRFLRRPLRSTSLTCGPSGLALRARRRRFLLFLSFEVPWRCKTCTVMWLKQ